ncbi:hypothetical protein [Massilia violaceinigra]|uniref:hypothetical protein n=1 Tax=Massilia violaceinigra TaxID=2045208 RepID=UPI0012FD5B4F|nr:hypothetical protein [Massilia violaceinigra]
MISISARENAKVACLAGLAFERVAAIVELGVAAKKNPDLAGKDLFQRVFQ